MNEMGLENLKLAIVEQTHEDYIKWKLNPTPQNKINLNRLVEDLQHSPLSDIMGHISQEAIFQCWDREVIDIQAGRKTITGIVADHRRK